MITISKIEEYCNYHGYYEGFYFQKVKNGLNISSEDDWFLIRSLVQDIKLIKKGLASKDYTDNLEEQLKLNCESQETINLLMSISDELW